jgi:integrase/recombinase XerD
MCSRIILQIRRQPRDAAFSPLPTTFLKLPPQQTPYIYSTEELRRLLDATSILRVGHCPHVPAMYRTLLLLLYGSGMRIGEVLRLVLQDVDLAEQVITVRDAKFFKTRLVPIGPKLELSPIFGDSLIGQAAVVVG